MTKMAATPIYGYKTLQNLLQNRGLIFTKLGIKHQGHQPIINCSNDDHQVTLTYFTARSNLKHRLLYEKVKTVDYLETIAVSDLKVGRSRHLIEYMKVCEY